MGYLMIDLPANALKYLDFDLAFMCLLRPPQTLAFDPVHSAYIVHIQPCYEKVNLVPHRP